MTKCGALTVEDLYKYLREEIRKGHGDYVIFVTDDEEANGYHALYYSGETIKSIEKEEGSSTREYYEAINHDLMILDDKDKAIYLG
ncbi:MAG TPA: hypothetical protein DDW20_01590 [Firmicutes bacterium]|nr:hypothetical protein [Bacillota bacterium]